MSNVIGIVDLTVRHSSMNPLGYISVQNAAIIFERLLLNACAEALRRHPPDDPRTIFMKEKGIVTHGGAAKFFQFSEFDDALAFATHLRSLLIEKQLPFKICLTFGTLAADSLRDLWLQDVEAAQGGSNDRAVAANKVLLQHFNTTDLSELGELFDAYRAPGFHPDEIALALRLDDFKGLGIWIAENAALSADDDTLRRLFYNVHPTLGRGKLVAGLGGFIDVRFPLEEDDIVFRASDQTSPTFLANGQITRISCVVDLLRRSIKAADENSAYYVSLLVTIVRSSYFGRIRRLASAVTAAGELPGLALGWQEHPPIFHVLIVDTGFRQIFKRVHGLELILGAIIDEVYAAQTTDGLSCGVIANLPVVPVRDNYRAESKKMEIGVLDPDGVFSDVVRAIEVAYGEQMLRKIWLVSDRVVGPDRKTAALRVTTEK